MILILFIISTDFKIYININENKNQNNLFNYHFNLFIKNYMIKI